MLITVLDSQDNAILGTFEGNISKYAIYLDKLIDDNISNNGIIFELTLSKKGNDEVFYFDGKKLTPIENIDYINSNGKWIIDVNSVGVFNLSDTNINRVINIDIPTLLSKLEDSKYKLYGNIWGEANSSITLQVIDMKDDSLANQQSVQINENGEGNYSIDIYREGNYGLIIDTPTRTLFYNGGEIVDINYFHGSYPPPLKLNSRLDLNLSHTDRGYSISGTFEKSEEFNNSTITAYSVNGEWLGEGKIIDGSYSINLPVSNKGDNLILKISNNETSYYLGSNNILLDNKDISIDENGSFELPPIFTPITLSDTTTQNGNLEELMSFFQERQYKIYGNISSLSETAIGQLIDISTGEYLDSFELKNGSYSIKLPNGGSYILYLFDGQKELFYDFNNSKFIPANSIDYIETNGFWIPNPDKTGYITLTSSEKQKNIDLDFESINSSILSLSGDIVFPSSLKWQFGYISVIDKVSGDEVAFTEINKEKNVSTQNGIKYYFNISIDNYENRTRQLIFKIYLYLNIDGMLKGEEIIYNFTEHKGENGKFVTLKDSDYLEIANSKDDIYLDLTHLGEDEHVLNVDINLPTHLSLTDSSNSLTLYLLSKKGEFIEAITINKDRNISLNLGETSGKYLIYLQYNHIDINFEKSYSKEFYLDFKDNNVSSLQIIGQDEIKFKELDGQYVPNISPLYVDRNISLTLNIEDKVGFGIFGNVTSSAKWKNLDIVLKIETIANFFS